MKTFLFGKKVYYKLITLYKDFLAIIYFLRERINRKSESPITVIFLCQYIPAWNKIKPIYNLMKKDSRFKTYLICIPMEIKNNRLIDPNNMTNETYEYFKKNGYEEAINARLGKNEWIDLKKLKANYVFYPRPYNSYMPNPYVSAKVSKYCKICVILYGINTTKDIAKTTLNRDFFRNVYCYFAETPYSAKVNKNNFKIAHFLRLQKTVCYGMPTLQQIMNNPITDGHAWDFSKNDFRIIWTPRWTTDLKLGGSNFFTYYKKLLKFAKEHKDMDFLFRPHPLAFDNFVKTGEMTVEEVDIFKKECQEMKNVNLDTEKEYVGTMWGSDVMISDISAMMPEYFVTGKPLIYCASNMILELDDSIKIMMEGCYVVNEEKQLFECLLNLKKGIDPLKDKRKELIEVLFGDSCKNSSEKIVEELTRG